MSENTSKINFEWLKRALLVVLLDIVCIAASYFLGLLVRYEFSYAAIPQVFLFRYAKIIVPWIAVSIAVHCFFRLYNSIWSFVGYSEVISIVKAYFVLLILGILAVIVFDIDMPWAFYCVGFCLSFMLVAGMRFSYSFFRHFIIEFRQSGSDSAGCERIMIVGAGVAGRMLLQEYNASSYLNGKVVCLIDDNPTKKGRYLSDVKIVGNSNDIPEAVKDYNVDRIIYAIPSAGPETQKRILNICSTTGCKIKMVPGIYQIVNEDVTVSKLKDVEITDLLGRDAVTVDNEGIFRFIFDKTVIVTGGGGSIGSELCRQIAASNPKQLIIFDIYENNAYDIQMELKRKYPRLNLVVLIGSVRDEKRMDYVIGKYHPQLLFHAAAHKHVPLMEDSPNEAIKNNVFGTYQAAKVAAKYGVEKFVLISTDKAVNPTNIMGASKRLCEMVIQMMSRRGTGTDFVAVRFGNVMGSNGSVIPLFKKQIAEGGPVTVTHPDIIRYFMTIPEAVSLILQAVYYAKGGEIFVLDMGEPVKIDDMARNLIRLSGYTPDVDIKIKYTGLRPGEKLYEEMLMKEEGLRQTTNKLIYIGSPIEFDDDAFDESLSSLEKAAESETEHMKEIVAELVPTYKTEEIEISQGE